MIVFSSSLYVKEKNICRLNMIDLDIFWGRIQLHKKGSRNIICFYLRKLSQLKGQLCSTALVKDIFCVKYCYFMRPKSWDKLSINIDHV